MDEWKLRRGRRRREWEVKWRRCTTVFNKQKVVEQIGRGGNGASIFDYFLWVGQVALAALVSSRKGQREGRRKKNFGGGMEGERERDLGMVGFVFCVFFSPLPFERCRRLTRAILQRRWAGQEEGGVGGGERNGLAQLLCATPRLAARSGIRRADQGYERTGEHRWAANGS